MRYVIGYTVNGKFHETIVPALAALLEKRSYYGDINLDEVVRELVSGEIDEIDIPGLYIKAEFE